MLARGSKKTRRRKSKNDHGSAVSRKCPKFRTFLQGDRLSIFGSSPIKSYPAITVLSPRSGDAYLLVEVGIGEFDFWLAVGVVEGASLRKSLFDDRPNFGYRSNGILIDELTESGAFNVAHVRVGVRCGASHNYFLQFSPIKLLLTSVISLLF